jgi:hypothetical protein
MERNEESLPLQGSDLEYSSATIGNRKRKPIAELLAAIPAVLLSVLCFLAPSFLGVRASSAPHNSQSDTRTETRRKTRTLHSTSYLDGLRGVAALFVVFAHYQASYFPYLGEGWHQISGQQQDGEEGGMQQRENNYLVQLPLLRTFYAPRFMVCIFFVISGYVLSQKSLGEFYYIVFLKSVFQIYLQ